MVFLFRHKKQVIIGVFALFLIVAIYLAFKKITQPSISNVPLPEDEPDTTLNQTDSVTARNLAILLHDDMEGWFDSRNNELYQAYAILSDTLFVAVYNEFSGMYSSEGYGSLRSWMNDESFTAFTGNLVKNTIFPRMDKLGLV